MALPITPVPIKPIVSFGIAISPPIEEIYSNEFILLLNKIAVIYKREMRAGSPDCYLRNRLGVVHCPVYN
jgi:hypothetical protein